MDKKELLGYKGGKPIWMYPTKEVTLYGQKYGEITIPLENLVQIGKESRNDLETEIIAAEDESAKLFNQARKKE